MVHKKGDCVGHSTVESKWKRICIVIIAFYIFDYISTFLFCSNPDEEGGFFASFFMKLTNSVPIGLTLNFAVWSIFWAMILLIVYPSLLNRVEESPLGEYVKTFEIVIFISLGYFPALDFVAATSWYSHIPILYRAFVGLMIYLISLLWVKPFEKSR